MRTRWWFSWGPAAPVTVGAPVCPRCTRPRRSFRFQQRIPHGGVHGSQPLFPSGEGQLAHCVGTLLILDREGRPAGNTNLEAAGPMPWVARGLLGTRWCPGGSPGRVPTRRGGRTLGPVRRRRGLRAPFSSVRRHGHRSDPKAMVGGRRVTSRCSGDEPADLLRVGTRGQGHDDDPKPGDLEPLQCRQS